jgi:hypothetical protein
VKKFDCGRPEVERLHKHGIGSNGLQFAVRGQKSLSVKRRLLNRGPRCPQSHDNVKQRRAEQPNAKSEVCHSAQESAQHETKVVRGYTQMMGLILL